MTVAEGFNAHVPEERRIQVDKRFGMKHGQFFAVYQFKNLYWVLDGMTIGYGDLRAQDIATLLENLTPNEIFEGFNEHHGSQFQQTDHAMIKITGGVISFPHQDVRGSRR